MSDARAPRNAFAVIALMALAKAAYDYQLLPGRLASHFGPGGLPNGWMTKETFFLFYGVVVLLSGAVIVVAPHSIANKPKERIRLPNKEYWLAPEHRPETMAYFRVQFGWYGCALLLTEVFAMELAIEANFHAPPRLATGPIALVIVGFVLFNAVWVIQLMRHFGRPGE
jgi:uncharacterized membrane protein